MVILRKKSTYQLCYRLQQERYHQRQQIVLKFQHPNGHQILSIGHNMNIGQTTMAMFTFS